MQVYSYNLHVNGIFGRKRNPQRATFELIRRSETKRDSADVIAIAQKELAKLKLRGKFALYEREGTLVGDIYSTKLMFDQKPVWSGEQ